jgi:hypothetical protein
MSLFKLALIGGGAFLAYHVFFRKKTAEQQNAEKDWRTGGTVDCEGSGAVEDQLDKAQASDKEGVGITIPLGNSTKLFAGWKNGPMIVYY